MKTAKIKQLNKKIDLLLGNKQIPIFPILGGASSGEPVRNLTLEEERMLRNKGIPVPIAISLNREHELKELLET